MESPFANLFTRPPSTVAKLRSQRRHMGGAAATGVLPGGRGRSEVGCRWPSRGRPAAGLGLDTSTRGRGRTRGEPRARGVRGCGSPVAAAGYGRKADPIPRTTRGIPGKSIRSAFAVLPIAGTQAGTESVRGDRLGQIFDVMSLAATFASAADQCGHAVRLPADRRWPRQQLSISGRSFLAAAPRPMLRVQLVHRSTTRWSPDVARRSRARPCGDVTAGEREPGGNPGLSRSGMQERPPSPGTGFTEP